MTQEKIIQELKTEIEFLKKEIKKIKKRLDENSELIHEKVDKKPFIDGSW